MNKSRDVELHYLFCL